MYIKRENVKTKIYLSKDFHFDSAHHLPEYDGCCQRPHGHRWNLSVGLFGSVDEKTRMLVDFKIVKEIVNDTIIKILDHQYLNNLGIPELEYPTAENIAPWIFKTLMNTELHNMLTVVKLWEAPDSMVKYTIDNFINDYKWINE